MAWTVIVIPRGEPGTSYVHPTYDAAVKHARVYFSPNQWNQVGDALTLGYCVPTQRADGTVVLMIPVAKL